MLLRGRRERTRQFAARQLGTRDLSGVGLAELARELLAECGVLLAECEALRDRLAATEGRLRESVELGLGQLHRATVAELEAEQLAVVAMADTINDLERTDD